jgi:glutaminyl-tRNA synthetase
VRLRYAYIIRCIGVVRDPATGEITELRCTYDPGSLGSSSETRRVKGTLHWVSAAHAAEAEVRLYDRLFLKADPEAGSVERDFKANLNPDSLEVLASCRIEPSLIGAPVESRYQFERLGYFCVDPDSSGFKPVFNRTASLRDTWAKIESALQRDGVI